MAATSVTITADADGKTLAVLGDLIAKRERLIGAETTRQAVTATAINVLSSVRAVTKVAKPNKANFDFKIMPAPGVVAGFKSSKGVAKGHRVVRAIGGHEMTGARVVNLAGKYSRKESVLCFTVIHKVPRVMSIVVGGRGADADEHRRHYVIARSANDVRAWAEAKMKKYIKRYAGMAKWIVGQAQSRIAKGVNHGDFGALRSSYATRTALHNLVTEIGGDGFNSGTFFISVKDGLRYATLALQNGPADVEFAFKKAANRTAGILNHSFGYRLDEPIPTPFPEVKGV